MASGFPSAGSGDARVDRPDEGLPGYASQDTGQWPDNETANPPTRSTFDTNLAHGFRQPKPKAVIDTSGTSGLQPSDDLKRGEPAAW